MDDLIRILTFRAHFTRWADRLGVKPHQLGLLTKGRRWAASSAAGTLSFSLDLHNQPPAFREYVIVRPFGALRGRSDIGALESCTAFPYSILR